MKSMMVRIFHAELVYTHFHPSSVFTARFEVNGMIIIIRTLLAVLNILDGRKTSMSICFTWAKKTSAVLVEFGQK